MDKKTGLPEVSVVIPTYNRAGLLRRAVKSVLDQTYQDFEIIVVDDCSTDDTQKTLADFKDERIKYVRHNKNKGPGASRNTGIRIARGRYIAFLDSDDEWLPEKLEKQVKKMSESPDKIGIIYGGHEFISEKTGKVIDDRVPAARGDLHIAALRSALLGGGSVPLIRKECFQKCGFFDETPSIQGFEDWDMYIRLSKSYEFDLIPEVLFRRYFHGTQSITVLKNKIETRKELLRKHQEEFSKRPSIMADHLNRLGVLYAVSGDMKEAKEYFMKSIRVRPAQWFVYAHLIPLTLFPKAYKDYLKDDMAKKSIDGVAIYW